LEPAVPLVPLIPEVPLAPDEPEVPAVPEEVALYCKMALSNFSKATVRQSSVFIPDWGRFGPSYTTRSESTGHELSQSVPAKGNGFLGSLQGTPGAQAIY